MSLKVTPGKTQSTGIQFDIPGLFGRWRVQKNQKIDAATQGKTGGIFQKFKGGNTAEAAKEIVQLAAQLPKRTGLNYQASLLENIKIMSAHVLGTNWVKDADRNLLAAAIRQEACQAELANPRTAEKEARLREIQPQVQGLQRQIQALDQQIAEKQEKTPSAPTYEVPDDSYDCGGLSEGWQDRNKKLKDSYDSKVAEYERANIKPLRQQKAAIEKDPVLDEYRNLEQEMARIQRMRDFVASH